MFLRLVAQRMDEHHGLAAVELGVELVLVGMAEMARADVGQQADAVELERVERVFGLADRSRDVRQRQQRERAEPVRLGRRPCEPSLRCIRGRSALAKSMSPK